MMKQKEIKHTIETIKKRASDAKRNCLFDGCLETAINSHLLQKNGIINQISENNQVYQIRSDNYVKEGLEFRLQSIKVAFAFPGFCSQHDNDIFKEIETTDIQYTDYRTQLLFCYRALMNEKRKKEVIVDWEGRILDSFKLKLYLSPYFLEMLADHRKGNLLGIKDGNYYENIFLLNIKDDTLRDFSFMTYELPKIGLCVSGVFSYETSKEIIAHNNSYKAEKPLTDIYINIIPILDKTIIIFGCLTIHKEICWDYINGFNTGDTKSSLKRISDLLICQVENWLCSPTIYKTLLKPKEREILDLVKISLEHENERRVLQFNIFENLLN
ncbi:MAG: hypothetical protein Q8L90_08710 [Bacteroidota bacterium]|nr:hypothetical protein [Bacteroidota bacterium]